MKILSKFFMTYYDEWVVGELAGVKGPMLSAGLCRAMEAAVSEEAFSKFVSNAVAEGKIVLMGDYKTEAWDTPVLQITDYIS